MKLSIRERCYITHFAERHKAMPKSPLSNRELDVLVTASDKAKDDIDIIFNRKEIRILQALLNENIFNIKTVSIPTYQHRSTEAGQKQIDKLVDKVKGMEGLMEKLEGAL